MIDDFDIDEIEYTPDEKEEVIDQLRMGLMFGEIEKDINKQRLKSWFADIQMHKKGEYCPDITGNDLIEIAANEGFRIY